MSGILMAALSPLPATGGGGGDGDYNSFSVTPFWNGPTPLNVTGAAGTTGNVIAYGINGGTQPYSISVSVLDDGGGKLGLVNAGTGGKVSWSGLAVLESQTITIQVTASDAEGNHGSGTASATIRRTS